MSNKKAYGLQLPKKDIRKFVPKQSIFGEQSDSDKSDGDDWLRKEPKKDYTSAASKRQSKMEIEKALKEDSTVFQYDEIYDDMGKQKETTSSKDKDKKPKYVQNLLVAAEKRKMENERRHERLVQKEREAEGDEFKGKETFVTSSYKKKLEEFAKLDAEQKRQDMLEEIGDVTKQQDISGFYRHMYEKTVGSEKEPPQTGKTLPSPEVGLDKKPSRQYRKRKNSNSSGENKDADSELSSSSDSSSSDSEKSGVSETEDPKRLRLKDNTAASFDKPTLPSSDDKPLAEVKPFGKNDPGKSPKSVDKPVEEKKRPSSPAIDIWKKRTVGPIFDSALQRYLERKTARQQASRA